MSFDNVEKKNDQEAFFAVRIPRFKIIERIQKLKKKIGLLRLMSMVMVLVAGSSLVIGITSAAMGYSRVSMVCAIVFMLIFFGTIVSFAIYALYKGSDF